MSNLFFFWGQEDFLINSEIENIKSKNISKNFETMAYKKLYEPSFDDMINAICALPMMFGNIMHVIDVNKFFLSKEKESEENSKISDFELNQFEKALANKSEKNIVILRCIIPPDSKKKIDTRKKLYKITVKYAQEKQFPLYRIFDKELPKIISKIGKNNGLNITQQVNSKIIEQVGSNLGVINSELQKLALTIYPKNEPTINDIENICTKKDDVFIILEAIFKKDIAKALYEFRKVLEKSSIQEIMAAIQYSLRNYAIIKAYYQCIGKCGLSQKLHIHEFVIEQNYKLMSDISGHQLLKLKNNLIKAEYAIKTGDCVDAEKTLEMALMGVYDV